MDTNAAPDPNQPPAPGTPPASTPPAGAAPPSQQGKNVMIPKAAFDKRVEQAKKSGRTAYQAELDAAAVAKGYANHAALMAHVDGLLTRSAAPRPPQARLQGQAGPSDAPAPVPPKNRNDRQAMQQFERDKARAQREREQSERRLADEQKRRRKAERERDAIEARSNLERIAGRSGVKDIDYAIHLYTQHCQGKSEDELGKMDEESFFKGLRQGHPYIFGETVVPATTGTAGAPPGSHVPPSAAGTAAAAGLAGSIDVTKMNKEQYREYRRTRGYDRPIMTGRAS